MKAALPSAADPRAQYALLALEHNRQQVRAAFAAPPAAAAEAFPRSATFRWISAHLGPRALLSTAAGAALARVPMGRLLGSWLSRRG
jgi:hypothetical protein